MKIRSASVHHYCLPLRASWLTAAGGFRQREGWLLRLDTADGATGYGDCAPLPGNAAECPADTALRLRRQTHSLIGRQPGDALQAIDHGSRGSTPAVRLAVETALLDLIAQAAGLPLAAYLLACERRAVGVSEVSPTVRVNAALGSVAAVHDQDLRAACAARFQVLKLKVGMTAIDQEIGRLQQLARLLPPGVELRLDANCAWGLRDAARFLHACADLPVEMVEEPLARPALKQLQALQDSTGIAIAMDESLATLDLEEVLGRRPVRRLVIKPTRTGGLLPALALARRATGAGFECIVTSSVESACGVTAAAHLAAALDNPLAHGLATCECLADDTGTPPAIANGRLTLPDTPGVGFAPHAQVVFSDFAGPDRS